MSMDEMIAKFEISDIHKAGAVLDPVKLDWMNGEYIKRMNLETLYERLEKYLQNYQKDFYENIFAKATKEFNLKIVAELQTRLKRFDEFIELTIFLYNGARVARDLLVNPKMKIENEDQAIDALRFLSPLLEHADFTSLENLKNSLLPAIAES